MKFAEFYVGQIIVAGPYDLTESELLEFANAYDPQWFHTDRDAASQGPFSGLIASGWQTCSIAMRMIVESALAGSESFASPGLKYVKWPNPVRPGDSLSLRAEVKSVRRSASKTPLGVLDWRWELMNQHQATVLELEATSLFKI